MPFSIPDTREYPWDVKLTQYLSQMTNPVTGGINMWDVNPIVGVDGASLGVKHVGYTGLNTVTSSLVRWDGTAWVTLMDGDRTINTPQLDIHVSQNTGSDSNDGKTASTAWKTISKFYQEINKYNLTSKQINLYLGSGTYSIHFPPTTWGGTIKVIGTSSATTTIQRMVIDKGTFVMVQNVTIAYPEVLNSSPFYWPIIVNNSSALQLGPNIVLGPVGNYLVGNARFHVQVSNNSLLYLLANSPITLTGSVNNVFFIEKNSNIQVSTYYNPTAGVVTPNAAPALDTGATYTYLPSNSTSDTVATINASGSITVGNMFYLNDGANITGSPSWKLNITGNVVGSAYSLNGSSSINGYVLRGSVPSQGIGYPNSISSGTKDATSTVIGTPF